MNEPTGAASTTALWNAYSSIYNSVRSADPDHMVIVEGCYGSWNWSMLPAPSQYGWTNIMYQMHEYQWNGTEAQVKAGSDNQVNDFNNHASWNVPGYIGEYNDFAYQFSTWTYSKNAFANGGLSATPWAYKNTQAIGTNWGWYAVSSWGTTPNIATDSSAAISS